MIQLYRCEWLSDPQRSNITCALNAMQEKSTFMGVSDMPVVRNIESIPNDLYSISKITSASANRRISVISTTTNNDTASNIESFTNFLKPPILDPKHDTRIVNEAFQV